MASPPSTFATAAVTEANLVPIPNDDFNIPAGAVGYTDDFSTLVPNATVHGLLPHMHQLGKRITLTSTSEGCLIDVPAWDFHWQQSYFYDDGPVQLPLGSSLSLSCTWDNPTGADIDWGENTTDEMCLVYVYATGLSL